MGIIYRPPNPVDFIDHFNNAQGKLPFHLSEVYLLGDFNVVLCLEKYFERLKETQLKCRLIK